MRSVERRSTYPINGDVYTDIARLLATGCNIRGVFQASNCRRVYLTFSYNPCDADAVYDFHIVETEKGTRQGIHVSSRPVQEKHTPNMAPML